MAGWLENAATELGVAPLDADEIGALLDLTRDVAHGTERRYAPLSAFLLGLSLAPTLPDERAAALESAIERLRQTLPSGD